MKKILSFLLILSLTALLLCSCSPKSKDYTAEIVIKDYGTITVHLDGDTAPITVENFVKLAREGFYDGLTLHRIIEGFMMQGGCPKGNGTGGQEDANGNEINIKGEFSQNGVENTISHKRGVISMARSGSPFEQYLNYGYNYEEIAALTQYSASPYSAKEVKAEVEAVRNSASSHFFIMHQDNAGLDGSYAAFGWVTSGMEIVDKICTDAEPTDDNGTISKDQQPIIETIRIIEE